MNQIKNHAVKNDAAGTASQSMDVFVPGIPVDVNQAGLTRELEPFMRRLNIADWSCETPKRKPFGFISFLHWSDGQRFLHEHGGLMPEQPQDNALDASNKPLRPRPVARLHMFGQPMYPKRSFKPVHDLTRMQLQHECNMRQQAASKPKKPAQAQAPKSFVLLNQISCGKNVFTGQPETLSFVQQTSLHLNGSWMKHGPKSLCVMFNERARMDMPYDIIENIICEAGRQSITFVLKEPPRFYQKPPPTPHSIVKWDRMTNLDWWPDHHRYVAHCLVYQLQTFSGHDAFVHFIREEDLLTMTNQTLPAITTPKHVVEDYTSAIAAFEGKLQDCKLPFPILFQIQTLVWNNYLHPWIALEFLKQVVSESQDGKWRRKGVVVTAESIKRLFTSIPYPTPGIQAGELNPFYLVSEAMNLEVELCLGNANRSAPYGYMPPKHQSWILKAQVTPTHIRLQGPDTESKNRVLRMFPDHTEYFLRVSFVEENGQDVYLNARVSNDNVFKRYREVLTSGIRIAGRHFFFLGFSHSSLRAHSTWFMASFIDKEGKLQTRDTILSKLGDFSGIRVPAKCAARIGQAFSETPWAVNIFQHDVRTRKIADVKSTDGQRVFSDGVGTISQGALDVLRAALPMRASNPTCFQVRWGGVKGMLALDSRLSGKQICVREGSMMKFPSDDRTEIGICDVASRPLRLVLNRQIIKILEDMLVDESWFFDLQEKALRMLRGVTASAGNTSTFLQYQDIATPLGFPSFFAQLNKMGIDYRRDHFLRSVVEHVVLRELRVLKHKARIPVDKGVTLFGIMDETGWLQENEIYVTFDKKLKNGHHLDATLVDGPVIITRCPALHPGDVRSVRMKTPPPKHPLRHLRNCVVFSQHGERDLPSQLSGGDLDGDLYNIIWDPRAAPGLPNFAPADYPRTEPKPLDRTVTREDIADFFINFMKTDILGLIANRHQVIADIELCGTSAPDCIKLAEMHSTAVDYSKTGIPVSLSDMPRGPRTRPDFMAPAPPLRVYSLGQIGHIADTEEEEFDDDDGLGRSKPRYHASEKILGKLYRGVDETKVWSEDIRRVVDMKGPTVWEQLKSKLQAEFAAYGFKPNYQAYANQAWNIRSNYETSTMNSMYQYTDNPRKPISEAEVFCGSVLNHSGVQTRRQHDSSIRLKEETERILAWIASMIRKTGSGIRNLDDYQTQVDDEAADETAPWNEAALQLSWACLLAGCIQDREQAPKSFSGDVKMESFRVVAAACLMRELNALRTSRSGGGYVGVAGRTATAPPPRSDDKSAAAKAKQDLFNGLVPTVALLTLQDS